MPMSLDDSPALNLFSVVLCCLSVFSLSTSHPRSTFSDSTTKEISPSQSVSSTSSSLLQLLRFSPSCLSVHCSETSSNDTPDDTSRIDYSPPVILVSTETTCSCRTGCGFWFSLPNSRNHTFSLPSRFEILFAS